MPTIRKRNGKWQVQVRLAGHPPLSKTFPKGTSHSQAEAWGLEKERGFALGDIPTERIRILRDITVREMIAKFQEDRKAHPHKRKRSYANENIALNAFLEREKTGLGQRTLADLKPSDFAGYR